MGRYRQALELDEDTLARCRRVLGEDHPDTLNCADSLAADLWSLGKYGAARDLDEDTLARRRRVLGEDHPDTLYSAHGLAACAPWVSTRRRWSWMRTPWRGGDGCWAKTTPTPSSRPATSQHTSARRKDD